MKRVAAPPAAPHGFVAWCADHPTATWEQLKSADRAAAADVRDALMDAQHHLCAFCEITLEAPLFVQVEHWFPKDPALDPAHNWGLDFSNLMAACEGGARPDVDAAGARWQRPIKETQHCGQAKGNRVEVDRMLDPRSQLPSGPVWTVDPAGRLDPRPGLSDEVGSRAIGTVQHLNLNSKVLLRLRKAHWDAIEDSVAEAWMAHGGDDAADHAARCATMPIWLGLADGKLANFWTTARAYYGPLAEDWLQGHPELLP
jgi:uncharacterized protein (TIGR02646 family)